MANYSFNLELIHLKALISTLCDKVDAIRGEIDLSAYEEDTGRQKVDEYDKIKFYLFSLEKKASNKELTITDYNTYEKQILRFFEYLGSDKGTGELLNNLAVSLSKLAKEEVTKKTPNTIIRQSTVKPKLGEGFFDSADRAFASADTSVKSKVESRKQSVLDSLNIRTSSTNQDSNKSEEQEQIVRKLKNTAAEDVDVASALLDMTGILEHIMNQLSEINEKLAQGSVVKEPKKKSSSAAPSKRFRFHRNAQGQIEEAEEITSDKE